MFYFYRFNFATAIVILFLSDISRCSFIDFSLLRENSREPTCVDIPKNMSLCSDIGYNKMRLPNLLNHDTLLEVQQQSSSWVPLLNVRCHPHTKVFLCSLFTPVCLENEIYPCRSLCLDVQKNCESRMRVHGYHWPDMLRCDKFPQDHDMCIKAPNEQAVTTEEKNDDIPLKGQICSVCNPDLTYEDVLSKFCQADVVLKAKVKRKRGRILKLQRVKILKSSYDRYRNNMRVKSIMMRDEDDCCVLSPGQFKYLIFAKKQKRTFQPISILRWNSFKKLVNSDGVFQSVNCSNLKTLDSKTARPPFIEQTVRKKDKKKKGKKKTLKRNSKKTRMNKNKRQRRNRKKKDNNQKRIKNPQFKKVISN